MKIKWLIKKIIFGDLADSETYIKSLKEKGMSIGERCCIYAPRTVCIDVTRPYLIRMGNDVKITAGVTILTHGYDWSVLAGMHDVVLGSAGQVVIGNNVFIGMKSTILKGVSIGNNVVIGANSLVNKDIPDNVVVAGNPAKVIMPIEEYYQKRLAAQVAEAFEIYSGYVDSFGKEPPADVFDEFFWLFHKRDDALPEKFARQMKWHDRFEETYANLKQSKPQYDGYEDFLKDMGERYKALEK